MRHLQHILQNNRLIKQICFKPHPRLFSELEIHPDWGHEKAAAYYDFWKNSHNCQLQTGSFSDLFMTSDAMIHDSGSFSVEYHYSQKPVLFLTSNEKAVRSQLNELGMKALDAHYIGVNEDDVVKFIKEVVMEGVDPMKETRKRFFNDYLLPPNGKSAAENIYNDIVESLWP